MTGNADMDRKLHVLVSTEAIRQVIFRYCRAIDRRDRQLLASVYWPDAKESRSSDFQGDSEGFLNWVFALLDGMERTQHFIGNTLIEVDGDKARAESYFRAYHRIRGGKAAWTDEFVSGRYIDRFECRGGEWRIAERVVGLDWFRTEEGQDPEEKGFRGRGYGSGKNQPEDPGDHIFRAPL